jgi:hypothetical protein
MKTINHFGIIAALATACVAPLTAQEPGAARPTGHVLLLQSERGLEGDIERFGDQYRVRRGSGEVWLPADKAARLCADWNDAYAFMKTRANLGDPDERFRLAHWCQCHNLRPQALIEAKAALDMRPGHEATRQLVAMLTRSVASPAAPGATPRKAKTDIAAGTSLAPDVSADSTALFATRVQPILMNACVNCHSGGRGGDFQLVRCDAGQRSLTQANLAAALAQIKMNNPALSPLLIKAISRHGNAANAPIKDRQAVPFKTMQAWIEYLLANNPQLRLQSEAVAKTTSEPVVFAQAQAAPAAVQPISRAVPLPRTDIANASQPRRPAAPAIGFEEASAPTRNNLDAFDPAAFNDKR